MWTTESMADAIAQTVLTAKHYNPMLKVLESSKKCKEDTLSTYKKRNDEVCKDTDIWQQIVDILVICYMRNALDKQAEQESLTKFKEYERKKRRQEEFEYGIALEKYWWFNGKKPTNKVKESNMNELSYTEVKEPKKYKIHNVSKIEVFKNGMTITYTLGSADSIVVTLKENNKGGGY